MGTLMDGKLSVSETETRFTAPTKCSTCRGKGRVKIEAFTDEELP